MVMTSMSDMSVEQSALTRSMNRSTIGTCNSHQLRPRISRAGPDIQPLFQSEAVGSLQTASSGGTVKNGDLTHPLRGTHCTYV